MENMERDTPEDKEQSHPSWIKWAAITAFVLWLFYVISAYYVVQKPLSLMQLTALQAQKEVWMALSLSTTAVFHSLVDILAALWIVTVAFGLGLWLLSWLRLRASALETAVYAVGSGLGFIGLGVLLLGLLGLLQTAVFIIFLSLLTIAGLPKIVPFMRRQRRPSLPKAITLFLALIIGMALFMALLPPSDWDGLFYHLKGPKLYLEAGRIYSGVDIPHLNFPFLFEMLFMLAMGIRGDVTAKLLHFTFIFLLAALVYVIARDHLKVKRGETAVLFLFSMPMLLNLGGQAYNDLALAFYQVAALMTLFQWRRQKQGRWLVLGGLLSGLAMGMKYTSFVGPLTIGLLIMWTYRREWRSAIRPLLTFSIPAAATALVWYVKSLILTGNPIYPFLFGGLFWDAFRADAYAGPGTGIGFAPLALLRLPHDLTLGLHDASADGQMGPLFLLFLPLIILYGVTKLRDRVKRPFIDLIIFALMQYLFWTIGVIGSAGLWQSRLMLPAFVALAPVLAWLLADLTRFDHEQFSLRRFIGYALIFVLTLNLIAQSGAWLLTAPHRYVLGDESRDQLLTRTLGAHYVATSEIADFVPADAVVLFLYEPRSYYCDVDCRPDSILDRLGDDEYRHDNAQTIAAAWKEAGITHLFLFDAGYAFVQKSSSPYGKPQNDALLDELQAGWLTPVKTWGDVYSLYALE